MGEDFKPGLEGVVAVETEIAEPDKEGGVLRYRGVDITELVGHVPYERVWGLLVDNDLNSVMPAPEPYEPVGAGLGLARRHRPDLVNAPTGAVRAGRADGERARRPPDRDRAARRRLETRQDQRDLGRAGTRRPRAALVPDDGDRRAFGAPRRQPYRPGSGGGRRPRGDSSRAVPPPVARRSRSAGG